MLPLNHRGRGAALALLLALNSGCQSSAVPPSAGEPVTVRKVVDGDTLDVVDSAGKRERIRILGIDTPELARDGRRSECYAGEARSHAAVLLRRQPVSVSVDPSQPARDSYDRRLAYVTAAGQDVGEQLISGGFARRYHPKNQPPPARDASYRRAEQQAREAARGLWGQCG